MYTGHSTQRGSEERTGVLRRRPAPLAATPETLTHDFWEEVWIVSGAITDLRGSYRLRREDRRAVPHPRRGEHEGSRVVARHRAGGGTPARDPARLPLSTGRPA